MEAFSPGLLRGLLLLIGAVLVVSVYLFSRSVSAGRSASNSKVRGSPPCRAIRTSADAAGKAGAEKRIEPRLLQSVSSDQRLSAAADSRTGESPLILHVCAQGGNAFSGADILRIAERARLERVASGAGEVLQCPAVGQGRSNPGTGSRPLFYVTSLFAPGSFDFEQDAFTTTGLSLFAPLPGTPPPLEVFDRLLACARLFAENLRGTVLDEHRRELTSEAIQATRGALQAGAGD